MIRWGAIARCVALILCPATAWGQRVTSSLDIGGAAMRYADSLTANGGALSPAIAVEWPRATLGGAATFSKFASGWSSQGAMNASVFSHEAGALVAELAGTAGGSAHQDGTRTGQALASARGHLMADNGGAWVGAGAGRTWDGDSWRRVISAELAAWTKAGAATFVASVAPTSVDDSVRYTDSQLSAHWSRSVVEIGAEVGIRAGATGAIIGGTGRRWGSVATTTWLARRVGLVLSGGTYPIDLTQGFPGGRFVTLSLRLRSAPTISSSSSADRRTNTAASAENREPAITFQATPVAAGQVRLEIAAPGATSVEVSGDFTAWKPIQLIRSSEKWMVAVPIARGTHQINIRLNGGPWTVPPGLTPISDEFGGSAGLLVIEP